jgi:hypothetical protein
MLAPGFHVIESAWGVQAQVSYVETRNEKVPLNSFVVNALNITELLHAPDTTQHIKNTHKTAIRARTFMYS